MECNASTVWRQRTSTWTLRETHPYIGKIFRLIDINASVIGIVLVFAPYRAKKRGILCSEYDNFVTIGAQCCENLAQADRDSIIILELPVFYN